MAFVIFLAGTLVAMTSFAMIVSLRLYSKHRQQFELSLERSKMDLESSALRQILLNEETERKRIGRDLHDQVAGDLVVLQMELGQVRNLVTQGEPMLATDHLRDAALILKKVMGSTRNISNLLNPIGLQKLGFNGGVWELINRANNVNDSIIFHLSITEDLKLNNFQELVFYRIVQELINNALKHSKASEVGMHFEMGHGVTLTYKDDGVGLGANRSDRKQLRSLSNRVESLQGEISILTLERSGLELVITVNHEK